MFFFGFEVNSVKYVICPDSVTSLVLLPHEQRASLLILYLIQFKKILATDDFFGEHLKIVDLNLVF